MAFEKMRMFLCGTPCHSDPGNSPCVSCQRAVTERPSELPSEQAGGGGGRSPLTSIAVFFQLQKSVKLELVGRVYTCVA